MTWTTDDAIALCREIEAICPAFGCHIALTGGALYKDGARKDLDVLFYRIRQCADIDVHGLFDELKTIGIVRATPEDDAWVIRATYHGRKIDCFFPEAEGDEYDAPVVLADEFKEEP